MVCSRGNHPFRLLAFLMVASCLGDTIVLQPGPEAGKDTFVGDRQLASENYGTYDLQVHSGNAYAPCRILIQLDLSSVFSVDSATLRLYLRGTEGWFHGTPPVPPNIVAHRVTGPWEELSVTWHSRPDYGSAVEASTQVNGVGWYEWDITALVKAWKSGVHPNHGVLLKWENEDRDGSSVCEYHFESSDSTDATKRPIVKIETPYTVLQPGPAEGKDTFVGDRQLASENYGTYDLQVHSGNAYAPCRTLIQFDLSPVSSVDSATLRMCLRDTEGWFHGAPPVPPNIVAHRVTDPWEELSVTWHTRPDYDSVVEASTRVSGVGWYEWDITALVQAWKSGAHPNYGLLLKWEKEDRDSSSVCEYHFESSDSTDVTDRPILAVMPGHVEGRRSLTLQRGWSLVGVGETCEVLDASGVTGSIWGWANGSYFQVDKDQPGVPWHQRGKLVSNHGYWVFSINGSVLLIGSDE